MTDEDRLERNNSKLLEANPAFFRALSAVLAELDAAGWRPRIQACWRTRGLHFSCLNWVVQKNVYSEIGVRRHPMKIATIRLQ